MILTDSNKTMSESTSYIITDTKSGEVIFMFDMVEECEFKASSTVVAYPTERGIKVTDYKYDSPDSIKLNCFSHRKENTKQQRDRILSQLEHYKSGLYAIDIQTKAGLRTNYTISGYTIPENADNYSLLEINLECQQIIDFNQEDVRDDSDMDTVPTGITQPRKVEQ